LAVEKQSDGKWKVVIEVLGLTRPVLDCFPNNTGSQFDNDSDAQEAIRKWLTEAVKEEVQLHWQAVISL
jgi:hypothetical protein